MNQELDSLVNTIQREMAKLYQQNLDMKDEIATLKQNVAYLIQFAPDKKLEEQKLY